MKKPLIGERITSMKEDIRTFWPEGDAVQVLAIDAGYDPEDANQVSHFNDQMAALWEEIHEIMKRHGMCPARGFQLQPPNGKRELAMKRGRIAYDTLDKAVQALQRTLDELEQHVKASQKHSIGKKGSVFLLRLLNEV
jgi:hypothetical protein